MRKLWKRSIQIFFCMGLLLGMPFLAEAAIVTPNLEVVSVSKFQNQQPVYSMQLTLSEVNCTKYVVERQLKGQPTTKKEVLNLSLTSMKQIGFQYVDSFGLEKHKTYQYIAYALNDAGEKSTEKIVEVTSENIEPTGRVNGPAYRINTPIVTFTLGDKVDAEGDSLEYRLYARIPNEPSTEEWLETWHPNTNNEQVTFEFGDGAEFEWMIRCVETDSKISDRELVDMAPDWQFVTIDEYGLLIKCYNDMGQRQYGTKRQPLRFEVEIKAGINLKKVEWNFGDGSSKVNSLTAIHAFNQLTPETRPNIVTAIATDEDGVQYESSIKIWIKNTTEGRLYDDEVWEGNHPINKNVIVPIGINLTIKPGTQIPVSEGEGLLIEGKLQAVDLGKNIKIYSQDQLSFWQGIRFAGSSEGTLDGVEIVRAERGVAATSSGKINLNNDIFTLNNIGVHAVKGNLNITNSSFVENKIYGIKEEQVHPIVKNCIFQKNGIAYYHATKLHLNEAELNEEPNLGNLITN